MLQIEGLDREIGQLNTDKSELYRAAKDTGLSPKVLKRVVAERRKDPADRAKHDAEFRLYWDAAHSAVDTPAEKAHAPARTRDADQIDLEDAIEAATREEEAA